MKIAYDREADAMTITLREASIRDSDEVGRGVIVDDDFNGQIVRLEILDASQQFDDPEHVEYVDVPAAAAGAGSPE